MSAPRGTSLDIDQQAILTEFLRESVEQLDELEQGLLALESRSDDRALLGQLFRSAHTLKGNAGMVGLRSLEGSTHALEGVLEQIQSGELAATADLVSLLLRLVDAFRRVIPRAVEGHDDVLPEHDALVAWLDGQGAMASLRAHDGTARGAVVPVANVHERSLRVDVTKLDRLIDLMGELSVARGRVTALLASRTHRAWDELQHAHHDSERLYLAVQEELMRVRMVALGPTLRCYRRIVRDLCLLRDKSAELVIEGEDVEVDTSIVEGIRDPLTHLIRNAIDHGIEAPAKRRAAGKPERGTLRLSARHAAGSVLISLSDDGGGIDREALLARAREHGVLATGERPDDEALLRCIFTAGLSTLDSADEVSGRGVGMDIVRRSIEALRGSVTVHSEPGCGTTVTLRMPLTLAIIDGFYVSAGGETLIVPLEHVIECMSLPLDDRERDACFGVIALRDKPLPYVRLSRFFGLPASAQRRESVLIVEHEGRLAAFVVDALQGASPTVLKPLASLVDDADGVSSCAILGNGRVALVIDVAQLLERASASAQAHGAQTGATAEAHDAGGTP